MNTKIKETVNGLLGNKDGAIIFEVGAHYGEDTIDMMKVFNKPVIYCFEPHPGNAAFMRKYFDMKSGKFCMMTHHKHESEKGTIYLYEVAISEYSCNIEFNIIDSPLPEGEKVPEKYKWIDESDYRAFGLNDSGGSSIQNGYRTEDSKKVAVQSLRFDRWGITESVGLTGIDFMWMDVQGAEKSVVKGGSQIFGLTHYVWTEFGETFYDGGMNRKETIELFKSINYKVLQGDGNNLLLENMKWEQ